MPDVSEERIYNELKAISKTVTEIQIDHASMLKDIQSTKAKQLSDSEQIKHIYFKIEAFREITAKQFVEAQNEAREEIKLNKELTEKKIGKIQRRIDHQTRLQAWLYAVATGVGGGVTFLIYNIPKFFAKGM